jgi:hypothetical protein
MDGAVANAVGPYGRLLDDLGAGLQPCEGATSANRRYDKRAYVFHGTVTAASVRLRLQP